MAASSFALELEDEIEPRVREAVPSLAGGSHGTIGAHPAGAHRHGDEGTNRAARYTDSSPGSLQCAGRFRGPRCAGGSLGSMARRRAPEPVGTGQVAYEAGSSP